MPATTVNIDIYRCEGQNPLAAFSFPDSGGSMLFGLLYCNDMSMLCSAREPFVLVSTFRDRCLGVFMQDAQHSELERLTRAALGRERHGEVEQNLTVFEVGEVTYHAADQAEFARIRNLA